MIQLYVLLLITSLRCLMPSWMNAFDGNMAFGKKMQTTPHSTNKWTRIILLARGEKCPAVLLRANNKWRLGENCVLYHGYKPSENRKLEKRNIRRSCSVGNDGVDCVAIVKGNEIDGYWLDSAAIVWESRSSAVVYRPHPSKDKLNFIAVGLYTWVQICHLSFSRLDDINLMN